MVKERIIMQEVQRKSINWEKTGKNLKALRNHNDNLRRFVCRKIKGERQECDLNCRQCRWDIDPSISQRELAQVFNVSEGMIANWEGNRSVPSLEDLYFYKDICGITLEEVVVFE